MRFARMAVLALLAPTLLALPTAGQGRPSAAAEVHAIALVRSTDQRGWPGHIWRRTPVGSLIPLTYYVGEENPAWSPDARWLVYVGFAPRPSGAGAEGDLYVVSADGKKRRRITHDPEREVGPSWSPDGRWIVFSCRNPRGALDVCRIDPFGRKRTRLTNTPARCEGALGWSRDSRRILFVTCGTGDVYSMPVTGGDERLLLRGTFGAEWSPDGRSVAYTRGTGAIYIADADGHNERQIAPPSVSAGGVRWSPDGKMLAFTGDARAGCGATQYRQQIFLLALTPGSVATPWECVPEWEREPAWQPR